MPAHRHRFTFRLLAATLAICRLDARARLPRWARGAFVSIARTPDELSIVCDAAGVPKHLKHVTGRRALGIAGVVDFATTGVIAGISRPLANAKISVFFVSTYDTDWVLVRADDLARAVATLRAAGHRVVGARASERLRPKRQRRSAAVAEGATARA